MAGPSPSQAAPSTPVQPSFAAAPTLTADSGARGGSSGGAGVLVLSPTASIGVAVQPSHSPRSSAALVVEAAASVGVLAAPLVVGAPASTLVPVAVAVPTASPLTAIADSPLGEGTHVGGEGNVGPVADTSAAVGIATRDAPVEGAAGVPEAISSAGPPVASGDAGEGGNTGAVVHEATGAVDGVVGLGTGTMESPSDGASVVVVAATLGSQSQDVASVPTPMPVSAPAPPAPVVAVSPEAGAIALSAPVPAARVPVMDLVSPVQSAQPGAVVILVLCGSCGCAYACAWMPSLLLRSCYDCAFVLRPSGLVPQKSMKRCCSHPCSEMWTTVVVWLTFRPCWLRLVIVLCPSKTWLCCCLSKYCCGIGPSAPPPLCWLCVSCSFFCPALFGPAAQVWVSLTPAPLFHQMLAPFLTLLRPSVC